MVYTICIGSNVRRAANLALARRRLRELFPDIRFSRVEETQPLFLLHSGPFSNQVARFTSGLRADEVMAGLKAIEREAGRLPEEKQREIVRLDIDLLACDAVAYKPEDMERGYIMRGLKELEEHI